MESFVIKYLENINACLQLDDNNDLLELSNEEIIKEVKSRLAKKRTIFTENKSILNEIIFSKKYNVSDMSEQEILELQDFADKVYDEYPLIDAGICSEAYEMLLEKAKLLNDPNLILIESLKKGNTLFNMDYKIFRDEILECYKTYQAYKQIYYSLLKEGKQAFNECLLNFIKVNKPSTPDDADYIFIIVNNAIEFWKKEQETNADELPFLDYILNAKKYVVSLICRYLILNKFDQNAVDKVLLYTSELKTIRHQHFSDYLNYSIIDFFSGEIEVGELLQIFKKTVQGAIVPLDEESVKKFFEVSRLYVIFMDRHTTFNEEIKESIKKDINKRIMKYINIFKFEKISLVLNKEILSYLKTNSHALSAEEIQDLLFNFTIFRHFPTFVHTQMVKEIAKILLKALYNNNKEYLLGILNNADMEYLNNNYHEIESRLIKACHFHDIGMHSCLECITNSYRRLTENEFEIIKNHTDYGSDMLYMTGGDPIYYETARLHHLWYDEQFGYPDNYCRTNNSPLIDIVSVADSIDAATDTLGRIYSNNIEFDKLVEELIGYSNTRYSKAIVDLLLNENVYNEIKEIVEDKRNSIFVQALKDFYI